ncbi:hypothetical protein [Verrucomicrobium sp. BvORR106]|uniref:hypothetical protein n=1 Tax=Verrucomicrobium sp. BvORR106 TaxID=1403819 RepID=UPI000570B997|nr:hypothetical protein [Verrucomicrobium sp. BvORR106]
MPSAFSGIGSIYYGQRYFRPDGSYVTTEWLIFFYFPVFPIRSLRVLRNPQADRHSLIDNGIGYRVLAQKRLCWSQVISTYGFVIGSQIWMVFVIGVLAASSEVWKEYELAAVFAAALVVAIPFLLVLWFRIKNKNAAMADPQFDSQS